MTFNSEPRQSPANPPAFGESRLDALQHHAFEYFLHETNPANGLVADKSQAGAPASIAAVGFALAVYPVGVARGWMTRSDAIERTLSVLRFFWTSPQGTSPDATGHHGFYYHFLEMTTGRRAGLCELSTVDTGFLLAGMLAAAAFFDHDSEDEREIRTLADALYRRADWPWACNGGATVTHGWKPESGFLSYRWEGYNEAILLYVLGLGSPTHPLPAESYAAWASTYQWKEIYGYEFVYGGPLFIHQFSHIWVDLRGIQDAFAREKGIDYCENSRRATYVQREYATRNPRSFAGYSAECWGLSAGDGPSAAPRLVAGRHQAFYSYAARGVPYGPDDGTLNGSAMLSSLVFAPEIVLPALRELVARGAGDSGESVRASGFNPTLAEAGTHGWISEGTFGLDQGMIVLMIENYRTGLLWRLGRDNPCIRIGLRRAGFSGGWL